MRRYASIFAAGLLALVSIPARAITLYPTADTYSTLDFSGGKNPVVTKRFVTKSAGATGSLYVSKSHSAFIQFGASTQLAGATVTGARLTLYFPSAAKPGNLDLSLVTAPWTETFKASVVAEPGYGASFAQVPAANVVAKQFVTIDVTPEVQAWVDGATQDNGFVITSPDGVANLLIGSKEGPGSGYPATLEVDVNNASGGPLQASSATFSGNVGIGTTNPDTRFTLTVQGEPVIINGTPNGNSTLMMLEDGGGNEKWHMQLEGLNGNLGFTETNVADDRFVLAAGGNVGIGTGSPSARLEVNGDAVVDGSLTASTLSGDGSALTNVGNAALGLCKISGFVTACGGVGAGPDPTHTFVYVRGTSSLAYVGDPGASGYPYQLTLMEPGTYTVVARTSTGVEISTQVTVAAGQTQTGVNLDPALETDPNNCGACGDVCPTPQNSAPTCSTGKCSYACNTGFADCDLSAGNGCEVNTKIDRNNCGACGRVCPAAQICVNGACQ